MVQSSKVHPPSSSLAADGVGCLSCSRFFFRSRYSTASIVTFTSSRETRVCASCGRMAGALGDDVRETLEEAANRRLLQVRRASYHVSLHTPLQGAKKGNLLLAPFFPFQHSPPRQHGFDFTFSSNTKKNAGCETYEAPGRPDRVVG